MDQRHDVGIDRIRRVGRRQSAGAATGGPPRPGSPQAGPAAGAAAGNVDVVMRGADVTLIDQFTVTEHRWHCDLHLTVREATSPAATPRNAALMLSAEADRLERLVSRFRDDSEITAVNRAGGSWTDVSWDFVRLLTVALDAAEATGGLVDPCLGNDVDAAGYRGWAGHVEGAAARAAEPRVAAAWREIDIRPGRRGARVRVPAGAALDLGATAKAWLADELAVSAADVFDADTLANMGGDLRTATRGEPWVVGAPGSGDGGAPVAMYVQDVGLATSGRDKRRWRTADGSPAHHLVDPRTGEPAASRWLGVSVLAADAVGANTLATAGLILDDKGPALVAEHGLDAFFAADPDRNDSTACIAVGRWPAPEMI